MCGVPSSADSKSVRESKQAPPTVQVGENVLLVPRILPSVLLEPNILRNFTHGPRKETHPAHQVKMELAHTRRNGPRVVVEPAREDVLLRPTTPAVGFCSRRRLAAPLLELALLRVTEPEVMPAKGWVDRVEVGASLGWVEVLLRRAEFEGGRGNEHLGGVEAELGVEQLGRLALLETRNECRYGHGERRRVGVGRVLDAELGRDLVMEERSV